jgi:hypothetical protein
MDKEKLKLIIGNLESLIDCLKSEVYSDFEPYKPQYEEISPYIQDYDEVFYDEDGEMLYEEMGVNKKYKFANSNYGDEL